MVLLIMNHGITDISLYLHLIQNPSSSHVQRNQITCPSAQTRFPCVFSVTWCVIGLQTAKKLLMNCHHAVEMVMSSVKLVFALASDVIEK
jgi:hypothetical protein